MFTKQQTVITLSNNVDIDPTDVLMFTFNSSFVVSGRGCTVLAGTFTPSSAYICIADPIANTVIVSSFTASTISAGTSISLTLKGAKVRSTGSGTIKVTQHDSGLNLKSTGTVVSA